MRQLSSWNLFVMKVKNENPDKSFKEVLELASELKKQGADMPEKKPLKKKSGKKTKTGKKSKAKAKAKTGKKSKAKAKTGKKKAKTNRKTRKN